MSHAETRPTAVFECPTCTDRVTVSHPAGLTEVVILCECTQNFPQMEHKRGHLEQPPEGDDD